MLEHIQKRLEVRPAFPVAFHRVKWQNVKMSAVEAVPVREARKASAPEEVTALRVVASYTLP